MLIRSTDLAVLNNVQRKDLGAGVSGVSCCLYIQYTNLLRTTIIFVLFLLFELMGHEGISIFPVSLKPVYLFKYDQVILIKLQIIVDKMSSDQKNN